MKEGLPLPYCLHLQFVMKSLAIKILYLLIPSKEISKMFLGVIYPLGFREMTMLVEVVAVKLVKFCWVICWANSTVMKFVLKLLLVLSVQC